MGLILLRRLAEEIGLRREDGIEALRRDAPSPPSNRQWKRLHNRTARGFSQPWPPPHHSRRLAGDRPVAAQVLYFSQRSL